MGTLGMWRWILCAVAVVVLAFASGCGRDSLMMCHFDYDCVGDMVCLQGACTDVDEATSDQKPQDPDDQTPDPEVPIPDVPNNLSNDDMVCGSTDECPFHGECYEDLNGACIQSLCAIEDDASLTGFCAHQACVVQCREFEQARGCGCAARRCDSASQCGDFACVDGACGLCKRDSDCQSDEICRADGRCEEKRTECIGDQDCPLDFQCHDERCLPADSAHCDSEQDCPSDRPYCVERACSSVPSCQRDDDCDGLTVCVDGQCEVTECRNNGDCRQGQFCDAGECVTPHLATRCSIATSGGVIGPGQNVALEAFAYDSNGNGVVASFGWSSTNANVAFVNSVQSHLVGGTEQGSTIVSAFVDANPPIACDESIEFSNLGEVDAATARVFVVHAETQVPVEGAEVVLAGTSAFTDEHGVSVFALPESAFDVSVFAEDFNFVTVQGVQAADVRIPLNPRRGHGPVAGFTGQFDTSALSTNGDMTVGLAGASIPGGLLEIDMDRLLGEVFMTPLQIPGMGGGDFPLPGGIVAYGQAFGFPLDVKKTYYANSSGGPRLAWGLAGRVAVMELFALMNGGADVSDVLGIVLPLFKSFDHTAQPQHLVERPRVQDVNDINGNGSTSDLVPDYNNFPKINLAPSVRQTLSTAVTVSNFPTLGGESAETVILVGGTLLDASGFVPLGLSAVSNSGGNTSPGAEALSMAPPHGSLVGGRFAVMALAIEGAGGATFTQNMSSALWSGHNLPTSLPLGTLPSSSELSLNPGNGQLSIASEVGPLYRVRMVYHDRMWDIWSTGTGVSASQYTHQVTLPPSAASSFDLDSDYSQIVVDAIRTNVSLDDLIKITGVGLRNVALVTTSYNRTVLD